MNVIPQRLKLHGDGFQYLGILVVNILLCIVTLGLYYPWARAKNLQYLYGETEFAGSRLQFHGTGKEMFKGFIKAIGILVVVMLVCGGLTASNNTVLAVVGTLIYLGVLALIIPAAIHGGLRYRMSRTSWRGIHFGYRGNLRELFGIFGKGLLLSVLTLGIYANWFIVDIRRYCIGHIRLGNVKFRFDGKGLDLLIINLKGFVFTILTLGIYSFWYARNLNHFFINNLKVEQDGNDISFQSSLTPGDIFALGITNYFLVVFTLGLGLPLAILRQMRTTIDNIELDGAFNAETVLQTEEQYTNATGDDMLDMLDIGLDF
jgi:uncharacterized membrane protein YjgN (DUF898 family)